MRRLALLVLLLVTAVLLAFASPVLGGDPPKPRRKIVVRGKTFPDRVAFLIDASGSMEGMKFWRACGEARRIAEGVSDDGRMRFYMFSARVVADPQGWIKCPDRDRLTAAMIFLTTNFQNSTTDLAPALEHVLADDMDPLGVVVVTDEEVGDADPIVARVKAANAKRKNPAIIGVIGIDPRGELAERIGVYIAGETSGTYMTLEAPATER